MFKHILVPTDFSEPAQHALDIAVDLAKKDAAALTLLHTYDSPVYPYAGLPPIPSDFIGPIRDAAERSLNAALAELQKRFPAAKSALAYGVAWQQILQLAKDAGADLIVMGTHGRRGLSHALLGSVAEKVVRLSEIPVLTTRGAAPSK